MLFAMHVGAVPEEDRRAVRHNAVSSDSCVNLLRFLPHWQQVCTIAESGI